jgi:homoserine dehydrogenase
MKNIQVAILGLGTVGGGTYDILVANHDKIASSSGLDIKV